MRNRLSTRPRSAEPWLQAQGSAKLTNPVASVVMTREYPVEAEDRAFRNRWERDLIIGRNGASQVGAVEEQTSAFAL